MCAPALAFNAAEKRLVARCNSPEKVQAWLNSLAYNFEADGKPTIRTLRRVVRDKTAHCLEGALAAAALLMTQGHPPRILCMEARDVDHNVVLYKKRGLWGCVAQSRDENLKSRPPKFRTLRDLVLSYHPYYWNLRTGDETDLSLRGFATLDLSPFDPSMWVLGEEEAKPIEDALYALSYTALFPRPGRTAYVCHRDERLEWVVPAKKQRF